MHGIITYIWLICMVNVGKYIIHGSYGFEAHFSNILISATTQSSLMEQFPVLTAMDHKTVLVNIKTTLDCWDDQQFPRLAEHGPSTWLQHESTHTRFAWWKHVQDFLRSEKVNKTQLTNTRIIHSHRFQDLNFPGGVAIRVKKKLKSKTICWRLTTRDAYGPLFKCNWDQHIANQKHIISCQPKGTTKTQDPSHSTWTFLELVSLLYNINQYHISTIYLPYMCNDPQNAVSTHVFVSFRRNSQKKQRKEKRDGNINELQLFIRISFLGIDHGHKTSSNIWVHWQN